MSSLEFRYAGLFWSVIYSVGVLGAYFLIRRVNRSLEGVAMAWFVTGLLGISYAVGYVAGNSTTSVATIVAGGLVAAIASVTSVVLGLNSTVVVAQNHEEEPAEPPQEQDRLKVSGERQRKRMEIIGIFLTCLAVGELCGLLAGGRAKDNYNCIRDARVTGKSLSDIRSQGLTTIGNVGTQVPLSLFQTPSETSQSGDGLGH